ncbi:MAG: IS3 family transposase, partial [Erysipelotrichaceae bacterium]|nr:IS3 family transposase [Erysipelotrichaceae bacterium]MBQ9841229.1 IS3 family transposase [Erysipelotrichaceae bacterium]
AMENYIRYYNEERINIKRKGLTPLEFRYQSLTITI